MWGKIVRLALAPAGFSVFAGDLLVGNFGNGRWAIAFGNGAAAGPQHGLFGSITAG